MLTLSVSLNHIIVAVARNIEDIITNALLLSIYTYAATAGNFVAICRLSANTQAIDYWQYVGEVNHRGTRGEIGKPLGCAEDLGCP